MRGAGLSDARSLFREGRYGEVLHALVDRRFETGAAGDEAVLLAARAELRLDDASSALARLLRPRAWSPTAAVVAHTLTGIARFRTGDRAAGLRDLESAHAQATTREERAEAAYYRAWAAYAERDLTSGEAWLQLALDDATDVLYARTLALFAYIEEARERYEASARYFRLALKALRDAEETDLGLQAATLHNVAVYGAELPDETLTAVAVKGRGEWPPEAPAPIGLHTVQTLIHIGIGFENEGRADEAFDAFDEAEASAQGDGALIAAALLESADLYRVLGEGVAARRVLKRAQQYLRSLDAASHIQDHMPLLECVCLAARLETPTAGEWLARYAAASKADDGRWALARDRRVQALELHARGLVETAVGRRETGLSKVEHAYVLWTELRYFRRAAYARDDLHALGRDVDGADAQPFAALAPRHPLVAKAAAGGEQTQSAFPQLTPALRAVLDDLCNGKSVRDVAQESGRSEFTIRNHLKLLFKAFGVKSSAALVAAAMRTGAVAARDKPR